MLKGEYVGLRAVELEDLPQLMEWRNRPELRKFFRETNEISSYNQKRWFESISSKTSIHKMFSIVELDSNKLIGACGLVHIDWVNRSADFSIYIGYDGIYIDDKYAVETASLMRDYGFDILNLYRLWAEVYSIDSRKIEFFKEIGFKKDGQLRQTYWFEGEWHDSIFFSLLKSDIE
jgi:RimJ/RimL family protein N-acetyltransferase